MVLGRFLRSTPPASPSTGPVPRKASGSGSERAVAGAQPFAFDRCLGNARDAQSFLGRSPAALFVDLEGTLLRTFSRDGLRSLPEDTHFSQSAQGEELLLRIRPHAMDFLLRMKREAGLRIVIYTATCRASATTKVEALERACPGFCFDFIIHQDTLGAWDDGTKRLRLLFGSAEVARQQGFLIDTKMAQVQGQQEDSRHAAVNAAAVEEFGPFKADSSGNLADMRTIYGVMSAEELAPIYDVFRNFEVDNSIFRAWLQKVRASNGTSCGSLRAGPRPITDGTEEEGEDWELVEAAPKTKPTEPLVLDDFYLVEGEASCSSEGGMATPRQAVSDDDDFASSNRPAECLITGAVEQPTQPLTPPTPPAPTAPTSPVSPAAPSSAAPVEIEKGAAADGDTASEGSSTTTDDEPSFRCLGCREPIFKACDIISANYHAQTSPGYLLNAANNVYKSMETQTAVYTTGRYTIQEVSCLHCAAVLGVTYSGAGDARNQYKVGKFLVGRDRLLLPPGVVHPLDKAKN